MGLSGEIAPRGRRVACRHCRRGCSFRSHCSVSRNINTRNVANGRNRIRIARAPVTARMISELTLPPLPTPRFMSFCFKEKAIALKDHPRASWRTSRNLIATCWPCTATIVLQQLRSFLSLHSACLSRVPRVTSHRVIRPFSSPGRKMPARRGPSLHKFQDARR